MECPFPTEPTEECPAAAAARRGGIAFFQGHAISDNPYHEGLLKALWEHGWNQSRMEAPKLESPRRASDRTVGGQDRR